MAKEPEGLNIAIDAELLEILACPLTGGKLRLSDDGRWLISDQAKVRFPIVEGIPHLLADSAEPLEGE